MELKDIKFNVSEIFYSIQGEGTNAGLPCIFVRLQGCRLRCNYCDTAYALELKQIEKIMTANEIYDKIKTFDCNFVEFTGGEPLEQEGTQHLVKFLVDEGYKVAIETAGYLSIKDLDPRIKKIMDIKCPDSKMSTKNNYENINYLTSYDEVKFVISSVEDYQWAKDKLYHYDLHKKCEVLFSPVFNKITNLELAQLILADSLPVRMQLQMHKYIWEPNTRGV